MVQTTRRRPFGSGGVEPSLTAQPPGLVPSEPPRAGCPIAPRPRNLPEYQAACVAAEGAPVAEHNACNVTPGMQAWHCGHFLSVTGAERKTIGDIAGLTWVSEKYRAHPFMVLALSRSDGITGWLLADFDAPVYVLAPAPDAIHAPGAGATADESTAAGR